MFPSWKPDNTYYHNWAWPRPSKLIKAREKASDIIKKAWPMTIKGQTRSQKATQARPHQDYIKAYMCYVMFRFCLGLEFKVTDSSMCALYLWRNLVGQHKGQACLIIRPIFFTQLGAKDKQLTFWNIPSFEIIIKSEWEHKVHQSATWNEGLSKW